MRRRANRIASTLLLSLLFAACHNSDVLHREYAHIANSGWEQQDTLFFYPKQKKDPPYWGTLEIWSRNNNNYPYQNLWLFLTLENNQQTILSDTIELKLANDFGEWSGDGWGTRYHTTYRYPSPIMLSGDSLRIGIVHGMRDKSLKGITEVGISIYK